jgi:pilus assembly protein CpaE
MGSKGGAGVTTVSCNYAVALTQDSSQRTLLIDLDLPLGDAILNFGVTAEYSTVNALQDYSRLDSSLLAKLLVKHSSGLSILAAPGKLPPFTGSNEAIDKLVAVARQDFDNVVLDMGSRIDLAGSKVFKEAFKIYLVTQASISELRNSNRLISHFFPASDARLEIVINRYENHSLGLTDEEITKVLTRSFQWKIPNDHVAVRKMQNTATPLAMANSQISRHIRQMAMSVNPKTEVPVVKKGFRLFW